MTKGTPYTDDEKIALLKGVNTYGIGRWDKILEVYLGLYAINNRSYVNLKDLYRNLCEQGLAIKDFDIHSHNHGDCFTEAARKQFNLEKGEKDDRLDDGKVYAKRRKNVPYSDHEKRILLLGVNTVGPRWAYIFRARVNDFKETRTAKDIRYLYRTLKNQGLAIPLKDLKENQDCFTAKARAKFNLKRGEKDPKLMDLE